MLKEITLADEVWKTTPEARHPEFRVCLEELRRAPGFDPRLCRLELGLDTSGMYLRGLGVNRAPIAEVTLPVNDLEPLMREYLEIIATLEAPVSAGGLSRMEALDMAKKVVHDRGGRALLRRCRPLGLDLDSARRLFSLWVTLRHRTAPAR